VSSASWLFILANKSGELILVGLLQLAERPLSFPPTDDFKSPRRCFCSSFHSFPILLGMVLERTLDPLRSYHGSGFLLPISLPYPGFILISGFGAPVLVKLGERWWRSALSVISYHADRLQLFVMYLVSPSSSKKIIVFREGLFLLPVLPPIFSLPIVLVNPPPP